MELPRKLPCIAVVAILLGVAATSRPVIADPSQQSMGAAQAAVREIRDQLQAQQQFELQPRTQYMHMPSCRKFLRRHS
jgi:hypothetical protein